MKFFKKTFARGTMFPVIAFLALFFLVGAVLGSVFASFISPKVGQELLEYSSDAVNASMCNRGDVLLSLISVTKYPLIIFLLGFTLYGFFTVPVVVGFKGFSLSFAIAAMVKIYGYQGLLTSAVLYFGTNFFTIPCIFIVSAMSFQTSKSLAATFFRKSAAPAGKQFGYLMVCAVLLIAATVFDCLFVPYLLSII